MKTAQKLRRRFWILAPSVLILAVFVWVILTYLKKPAVGTTIHTEDLGKITQEYGQEQFDGRLFTFRYTSSLQQKEYEPKQNGIYLERVTFSANQPLARHLTASVRTNADSSDPEIPDIKKRRLEPTLYSEETVLVADRTALLFVRTAGGFEKTVFIPRSDGSIATISLTSAELGRQDELNAEWQQLIASFVLR